MRCQRCGQVFTVKPGHLIAHDRRQGAVYIHCTGVLVVDGSAAAPTASNDEQRGSGSCG
jgi:hypothetical protein